MKLSSTKIILIILAITLLAQAQPDSTPAAQGAERDLVYVLHGLGRTKSAMWVLGERIKKAGFDVRLIGYHSLKNSPAEILRNISDQINASLPDSNQTVHFVGHSMGGLMIRAYLDSNRINNPGRVVLIGTPNKGTTFVDIFQDTWWLKMLGPMTLALGTDKDSFPNSIGDPWYPVGIIAGVSDVIQNDEFLPGKDDGLVPLESAKLDGMTDILVIKSGHGMLRYNRDVADQTIEFLRNGKFKK